MPQPHPPRLFAILLALFGATSAVGDGKFFGPQNIVDEPGIRAQRAVIAWKDGVQTLIVQSDIAVGEKAAKDYGWILPLPAEPTAIEACAPHTLTSLSAAFGPSIAPEGSAFVTISLFVLLITLLACEGQLRKGRKRTVAGAAGRILLFTALSLLFFVLIFMPSLRTAGGAALVDGVDVTQSVKAGVYDVQVIKGADGQAVIDWLTANGFSAPPAARAVIDQYVADDWRFLAAKVSPDGAGNLTHHPLKVTFPATHAVYPLRLTGSDGEAINLDLFVIGDQFAMADGMRRWAAARFDPISEGRYELGFFDDYACEIPPVFEHDGGQQFGIPDVTGLMWPSCAMTRLHGRLSVGDMRKDMRLGWREEPGSLRPVHSTTAALGLTVGVTALVLTLLLAAFALQAGRRDWTLGQMLRKHGIVILGVAALAGAARYATLDVVPVTPRAYAYAQRYALSTHRSALGMRAPLPELGPAYDFPAWYAFYMTSSRQSPAEFADLDRPGDYVIKPAEDGWRLTIIDRNYTPVTIRVSAEGRPLRAHEAPQPEP